MGTPSGVNSLSVLLRLARAQATRRAQVRAAIFAEAMRQLVAGRTA